MSIAEHRPPSAFLPILERVGTGIRPVLTKPALDRVALALFAVFIVAIAAIGLKKPEYNWDMAAYVAAAIKHEHADADALHKSTWSMIEERAPAAQTYKLQAGNPYNLHLYQNPRDFHSMLPMYEVKIAYIAAIRYLAKLGGPVDAAVWISVISAFAFGLLCLWWMHSGGFAQGAPLLAAIMLLSGYFYMARIATPDLLFAAFCLGGIYLLLRSQDLAALPLLFAAFLVRPDNIIFLFALCLAAIFFGLRKTGVFLTFAAALAAYFWITSGNDHPGWWAHFYFSCVEIQNSMINFQPDFSLTAYLKGVVRGISVSLLNNNWPKVLLVLLFGWALLAKSGRAPGLRATAMLVAIILTFAGKFATFPLPDDRTYFVYIVAFAMILLESWKPRLDLDRADTPT